MIKKHNKSDLVQFSILIAVFMLTCFYENCKASNDANDLTAKDSKKTTKAKENYPKLKFMTNSLGMEFVWIPPGKFMMGSLLSIPEIAKSYGGVEEAFEDEFPSHPVTLTKGFWVSRHEVTQSQYVKIMGNNPSLFQYKNRSEFPSGKLPLDVAQNKTGNYPVDTVSWDHAVEFCEKLSEKENKNYSLPTEAQWEYFCRAGTTTPYSFGNKKKHLENYAWYDIKNGYQTSGPTHPVGQKAPTPWGLYDVHGNVAEWCLDMYHSKYYSQSPKVDPYNDKKTDGKYITRVLRGGCYVSPDEHTRSASRDYDFSKRFPPDSGDGFRVICWDLHSKEKSNDKKSNKTTP